jgi:hypothetical protein
MFDFSKMDDTPLKQDLQNLGGRPNRNGDQQAADLPPDPQRLAYRDAFSLASQAQSEYYNPDGTPRETTQRAKVSFGDDTTLGSGIGEDEDMLAINTNEHLTDEATDMEVDDNANADCIPGSGESATSNKTSASKRSAGSLAREQVFANEREKFNAELNRVKERNRQERENQEAATVAAAERVRQEQAEQQAIIAKLQKQMAVLQATQANSREEEVQETPTPEENQSDLSTDSDEEQYVDKELEEAVEMQAAWRRKYGIPLASTAEVGATISPADPLNQDNNGAEDKDSTPSEVQETPPPADPPNLPDSGAAVPPPAPGC